MPDEFVQEIRQTLAEIKEAAVLCGPCREMVHRHDGILHGNGKEGLVARMKSVESRASSGHTRSGDVVSVKSLKTILVAVGVLCTTLAAAIGAVVQVAMKGTTTP